jgi:hypothetical protein
MQAYVPVYYRWNLEGSFRCTNIVARMDRGQSCCYNAEGLLRSFRNSWRSSPHGPSMRANSARTSRTGKAGRVAKEKISMRPDA